LNRGLALTAIAVAAASSSGGERNVAIPGKFFAPSREVVLIGDTVTWHNGDATSHSVTADDGSFDSGAFGPGGSFSQTFASAGTYKYHCSIHRYMRGEVDVYALALKAPGYAVPFGLSTALVGLAPPSLQQVTVRRRGSDGSFVDVGIAAVADDGSFRFPLVAETSGSYVAGSETVTSPTVTLSVAARVHLRATVSGRGRLVTASVWTDPAQPGAQVQLQRYLLERFDFVSVQHGRLDRAGRAVFHLRNERKLHLRALLPEGVGGYGRAVSSTLLVRSR
jgi:plastocyanin